MNYEKFLNIYYKRYNISSECILLDLGIFEIYLFMFRRLKYHPMKSVMFYFTSDVLKYYLNFTINIK